MLYTVGLSLTGTFFSQSDKFQEAHYNTQIYRTKKMKRAYFTFRVKIVCCLLRCEAVNIL